MGIATTACFISSRTWFLRYFGCLKVLWSNTKKYDNEAQTKYTTNPKSLQNQVSLIVKPAVPVKHTMLSGTNLKLVCKCSREATRCGMPNPTAGSSLFSRRVGRNIEEPLLRLLAGWRRWMTRHFGQPGLQSKSQTLAGRCCRPGRKEKCRQFLGQCPSWRSIGR